MPGVYCPCCRMPIGMHSHGEVLHVAHPQVNLIGTIATNVVPGFLSYPPAYLNQLLTQWASNRHDPYGP